MKLFIGCASSNDIPSKYLDDSKKLLSVLLKDNDLIYGAYNKGIMGIAYDEAKRNGNKVIGYAPRVYEDDVKELDLDETVFVDNILERTNSLIKDSDAIIFLPGGIGTFNEIFASIDSKRCNEHNKPIVFYNSNHYFDKLFEFLEKQYDEKFSPSDIKKTYHITDKIDEVIKYINEKEV